MRRRAGSRPQRSSACAAPRPFQVARQGAHVVAVRCRHILEVVELDAIRRRDVLGGQEPRVRRESRCRGTAAARGPRGSLAIVGEGAGVGVAVLAAAGAAVQRAEVRVVVRHAAVPAEDDEPAKVLDQPDRAQPAFDDAGLLREREPQSAGLGCAARPPSTATRVPTGCRNHPRDGFLDRRGTRPAPASCPPARRRRRTPARRRA